MWDVCDRFLTFNIQTFNRFYRTNDPGFNRKRDRKLPLKFIFCDFWYLLLYRTSWNSTSWKCGGKCDCEIVTNITILSSKSHDCHHRKVASITLDLRRLGYFLIKLLCIQTTTLASKVVQLIASIWYDSTIRVKYGMPVLRIIPLVTNVEPKEIIDWLGHFKWYISHISTYSHHKLWLRTIIETGHCPIS